MQLAELVKDWPCKVKGSVRTTIEHIVEHSKYAVPQSIFFAHKGRHQNGTKFIAQAIENGASTIVTEDEQEFDGWQREEAIIWVPNSRIFCAYASHRLYGEPSDVLPIIAVTGTNGKTTVSHFIGQLAQSIDVKTLVIGTNGIYIDGELLQDDEPLTTKSAVFLQRLLQRAVREQVQLVVLEASSMGLEQHRLDYCAIDVGVFLNVSPEHIEDHETFDHYKAAKRKLVPLCEQLVCNADDAFCHAIAVKCKQPVMLYSIIGQGDLSVQLLHEDLQHSLVNITLGHFQDVSSLSFAGSYLQSNVAAALSALCMLGVDIAELLPAVSSLSLPSGRMQNITLGTGAELYIDYAHTPAAFKHVLQHLERHCVGKLIVVFSCGGERDKIKRQEMGRLASKYADIVILTTDNCRTEKPEAINNQIRSGFFAMQQHEEILDRKAAIERAMELADEGDLVLIAGKGHETEQIIGYTSEPFNDYETVMALRTCLNDKK